MSWDAIRDVVASLLLVLGGLLSVAAGVGLLRFPDVLSRMHSATKPQVFGLICILAAMAVKFPNWGTISTLILIALFQMMTIPVSAHMVGRAAYRTRHVREDLLHTDELADAVEEAERAAAGAEEAERSAEDGGEPAGPDRDPAAGRE